MKTKALFLSFCTAVAVCWANAQYLPTGGGVLNGNLQINGTDAGWAENLLLIKPSGWGGVRFARHDPSAGNYEGNWAIGYNANTGNDLSISSSTGGAQYDYLFHLSLATRNVGIGTPSPRAKLEINSAASNVSGLQFTNLTSYSPVSTGTPIGVDANGNVVTIAGQAGGSASQWQTYGNNIGYGTGNVGIGNSNAQELLTVGASSPQNANDRKALKFGEGGYGEPGQFGANSKGDKLILYSSAPDSYDGRIGVGSSGNMWLKSFGPSANGSGKIELYTGNVTSPRMVVTETGSVGIGTTSPGLYTLAVEGMLGARKIKVTSASPWADYVFDTSYQLEPLAGVETYIRQNGHLSGIPSAKEVARDGVDVGEGQTALLKKIEELTLYAIAQEKMLKEQQQTMAVQAKLLLELGERIGKVEKKTKQP